MEAEAFTAVFETIVKLLMSDVSDFMSFEFRIRFRVIL